MKYVYHLRCIVCCQNYLTVCEKGVMKETRKSPLNINSHIHSLKATFYKHCMPFRAVQMRCIAQTYKFHSWNQILHSHWYRSHKLRTLTTTSWGGKILVLSTQSGHMPSQICAPCVGKTSQKDEEISLLKTMCSIHTDRESLHSFM